MKNFYLLLFGIFSFFTASSQLVETGDFITIWKTDNPGTSASNQITIPATGSYYTIEWEEVANPSNNGIINIASNVRIVTFPSAGTYKVTISNRLHGLFLLGTFSRLAFESADDCKKLLSIEKWGTIKWSSMVACFRRLF